MKIRSRTPKASRIVRSVFAAMNSSLGYVTHPNKKYDEEFLSHEAGFKIESTLRNSGLRVWGSQDDLIVEDEE